MKLFLSFAFLSCYVALTQSRFEADVPQPEAHRNELRKYFLDLFNEAIAKRKRLETAQNRKQSGIERRFGGNEFESFSDKEEHPENNEIVENLTGKKSRPFEAYGYGHHKFHHHKHSHTNDHQHLHSHGHKHKHENTHDEKFLHIHNHKHLHKHDHHHDHAAEADHEHAHEQDHKHLHEHKKKPEWRRNSGGVISTYNW